MRVLLVEDELDLGAAVERALVAEKYIVDRARNGREALDYLGANWVEYSLAVIDWMLPELSGLELCQILRKRGSSLPILILTARDRTEDKIEGLDAGADDYLVKPFRIEELLARLRALSRRVPLYRARELTAGKLVLNYSTRTVGFDSGEAISLTTKEFQLLEYLMRNPNRILTGEQIRDQLWELDSESMSNVVAAQMRLLRKKLALVTPRTPIETLYGVGYRFNPDHATE
jgi:DNA-binding response OmpR family regulator